MLEPPPGELPALTVIAQFSSDRPVVGGGQGEASELTVCWYTDTFPADLLAHVTEMLQRVNWEAHAENFEW